MDLVQVLVDSQRRVCDEFADEAAFVVIVIGGSPSTAIRQARSNCAVDRNISKSSRGRMAAGIKYLQVCVSDCN